MKQKKWKDCPACGFKGSMKFKEGFYKTFTLKNYPPIKIGPLDEYICQKCHEGIYTIQSDNLIEATLACHKAKHEADKTLLTEVCPVSEASEILQVSRQMVIKLMIYGKIPYVFWGNRRIPKKEGLMTYRISQ